MLPDIIFTSLPLFILLMTIVIILVVSVINYFFERKRPLSSHLAKHDLSQPHPFTRQDYKEIEELEDEFQRTLENETERMLRAVQSKANRAEDDFTQFLADLKTRSQQSQELLDAVKQEKVEHLFKSLEDNVVKVIDQTVNQTLTTIQQELDASRKFVTQYSEKQLTVIDQNLIDLLERTLSLVLIKKLSLRDQLDLVYEALEKAKVEKFLVSLDDNQDSSQATQSPSANAPTNPTPVPQNIITPPSPTANEKPANPFIDTTVQTPTNQPS
jgi:hypothetical protein